MVDKKIALLSLAALSIFLITAILPLAQMGEIAGQPHFNVSLGGSQTINIIILNQGQTPLPYRVVLPTLSTIPNTTTPTVSVFPASGSIPAASNVHIAITVHMPEAKNKPGLTWTGILQIVEVANTSTSGATVVAGVAKIVTITSSAHIFSIWDIVPYAIVIILIAAAVAGVWYYKNKRRKAPRASKATSTRKTTVVSSRVKGRKTSRKTTRRGKSTKRKNRTATKRRRRRTSRR